MKPIFSEQAWVYLYWQSADRKMLERIHTLIRKIQRIPFKSIGKPEPLRHTFASYCSRRMNDRHRIVYRVEGDSLYRDRIRYHF
ncbi:MAG TPA: Txe/YoeB family addiction module toxin [Thermoanaerobaculia bacterium]|nr:Txe/YoeB family addiction module toxin [Thermoanaerobaculia bacterium]